MVATLLTVVVLDPPPRIDRVQAREESRCRLRVLLRWILANADAVRVYNNILVTTIIIIIMAEDDTAASTGDLIVLLFFSSL